MDMADTVTSALREHRSALEAFVRARVPAGEVDDVLQNAALRAVEGAQSLRDPTRALAWLYRVHRNAVADAARSRASRQRMVDVDAGVPEVAAPESPGACGCSLAQARSIKPSYAEVLELVDIQGASLEEAAQALHITPNNAAVRLHRARKTLKDTMAAHCGVTSARDCASCRCVEDGCC